MTYDIRMWLYPGASPNTVPTLWGPYETNITAYVRRPGQDGGAPISYSWGKQDESLQTDPGQMTLTLDNRDGRFSTDKIDGPYYGLIDTNTPIRLGIVAATDLFGRTVAGALGSAAGWAGAWTNTVAGAGTCTYSVDGSRGIVNIPTAATATLALLGSAESRDVDLVSKIVPLQTATGASYGMGHIVRYTDNSNYVYSTLEFNTGGTVTLKIRRNYLGPTLDLASINPIPAATYTPNNAWYLRTQMDGDVMRLKAWPASGSEPADWMISADDGDNAGAKIGIYTIRFNSNTNTGNLVGLDDMTVIGLEWSGFVVSWPLRWDITARNSWAPITANGILRRLRQGTNPIQSPLRRQLGATADATGYWPMEEGSDSKYFLGVVPGTAVASIAEVTPAGDTTLPGGGPAPVLNTATGSIRAQVKQFNNGNGMSAMVLFKLPSLPATKTRIMRVRTSRGPASVYDFSIDNANTYVDVYDSSFTLVSSAGNVQGVNFNNNWIALQIETDNSGGSTAWTSLYHKVGEALYWAQTGTVAGATNTNVSSMELTGLQQTAFAHIWMGRNTLPFVTDSFSLVSDGYRGETAAARFARISGEAGLSYSIGGPNSIIADTQPMGPQREGTTMAVLQSCADAEYGVLIERGAGLEFIPRAARWNLAQVMALTVSAGEVADIPQPTRDDQRLRNKWTVGRADGGSSSYQNDVSVARNGTWEDSATLNVYDDSSLENHAAWRVNIGSRTQLRWPSIAINFARNPHLIRYWRQRYYGWRLGVTSGLIQVTGNEPDLVMEGFQATLTPELWVVEMNCTDAKVWVAAVADDTGIYGRIDNEYCTTTALISSTTLTIPITTGSVSGVAMPKWDNTAGLWTGGVDFNVGGERVTVTSITNGAGQAQTLNATTRGVNGYAVSHASGASVSLWLPATVAL